MGFVYVCSSCQREHETPVSRCTCGSWKVKRCTVQSDASSVRKLADVDERDASRINTYDSELNRVLGGGVVLGSQIVFSGDPAVGKSTLLTQVSLDLAEGDKILYVCGEESIAQVKSRCLRLGKARGNKIQKVLENLYLSESKTMLAIEKEVERIDPLLMIVDSINAMKSERDVGGSAQIVDVTEHLTRISNRFNLPIVIVAHVTKDSVLSGPKALEHMVDVYLHLEGDRREQIRFLRSVKNRFGSTDEVGIFEMSERGLGPAKIGVDLSARGSASTSCLALVSEGTRLFVHEIQASFGAEKGKVHARGLRSDRVQMLAGILRRNLGLELPEEIFIACVGGVSVSDSMADMAICAALLSAFFNKPIPSRLLAYGELSPIGRFTIPPQDASKRALFVHKHIPKDFQVQSPENTDTLKHLALAIFGEEF